MDTSSRGGRCDDSRGATEVRSPRSPWCSLAAAAQRARPGTTVLIRAGSYPRTVISGVSRRRAVTFKPYPSERPVLRGFDVSNSRGLRLVGLRISDQTVLDGVSKLAIVKSDISPHGIHIDSGTSLLFKRNRIHDLTMRLNPSTGRCMPPRCGYGFRIHRGTRLRFIGNEFQRIPADGIQSGMATNYLIKGNEFRKIHAFVDRGEHSDAIQFYGGSRRVKIKDNRFDGTRGPLIGDPGIRRRNSGLVIENNLIVNQRDWALKIFDAPRLVLANNTVWDARLGVVLADSPGSATRRVRAFNNILDSFHAKRRFFRLENHNLIGKGYRRGRNDLRRSPRFRAVACGRYELTGSSPAIDAGISKRAPRRDRLGRKRKDIAGVPNTGKGRRYFDIGAHEFTGRYRPPSGSYADRVRSEPGLAAYWRLGERSGASVANLLGGLAGKIAGAVGLGAPGAIAGDPDTSARFDGGRISFASDAGLKSVNFTVEGWTKLDSQASANNALYGALGSVRLLIRPRGVYAGAWIGGAERVAQALTPNNLGRWVHWAAVRAGRALIVYRNGDEVARTSVPAQGAVRLDGTIGAIGNAYPARGLIDEVAVYGRPLESNAVSDHHILGARPRSRAARDAC